ncbi:hypothetical protein BN9982_670017 [Mycobacterium tuberculosis]|nr:hypothetical protein BN9982_670017 [Mycobacterium tuberculosis]
MQHVKTAHVRQHHVEHNHIGPLAAGRRNRRRSVTGGGDVPTFIPQCHGHHLGQNGFVVDHQHSDRLAIGAPHYDTLNRDAVLRHSVKYPHTAEQTPCGSYVRAMKPDLGHVRSLPAGRIRAVPHSRRRACWYQ